MTNETQPMAKSVKSSSPVKNSLALQIHTTSQREPEFKPETNSTSEHRTQLLPLQQGAPERLPLTDRSARGTEEGKEGKNRKEVGKFEMGKQGLIQSEIEGLTSEEHSSALC